MNTINAKHNDYLISLNDQGITKLNCELVNKRTSNHAHQSLYARTLCTAYLLGELKEHELAILLGRYGLGDGGAMHPRYLPSKEEMDKVLRKFS